MDEASFEAHGKEGEGTMGWEKNLQSSFFFSFFFLEGARFMMMSVPERKRGGNSACSRALLASESST